MATSARIKLFKPLNIWLAVNAVILLLLLSAVKTIEDVSRLETERLVKMQIETLVRARIHDLEQKNYRLFVEGAGRDLVDTFIEVKTPDGNFSYGERVSGRCADVKVPLVGTTAEVNLCKPSNTAFKSFLFVIAATHSSL